jgi:hypothetical protein
VVVGLAAIAAGAIVVGDPLAVFREADLRREAVAGVIAGHGLVALGLLRLSAGAWRRGRRLERDVTMLQRQLAELREAVATRPPALAQRIAWEAPPRASALRARGLDPSRAATN